MDFIEAASGSGTGLCAGAATCVQRKAYLGARSLGLPIWNTRHMEDQRFHLQVRLILHAWQSKTHHLRCTTHERSEFAPHPIHIIVVKLENEVGWTESYIKLDLNGGRIGCLVVYNRRGP